MEKWESDFGWLEIRHKIKDRFEKNELPDLNAILFLIGINELGDFKEKFTKEEKQDLMHIAVCKLLSFEGYYVFEGRDEEGWPHYALEKNIKELDLKAQEQLLKSTIIKYFNKTINI